jgi:hypothetical protein
MFEYDIKYVDEENNFSVLEEKGFVAASSYGDAASRVAEYYGEKNICDLKLCAYDNILTLDEIKESLNI